MFHENLKRIRLQKGLSQDDIAKQLHVTRQTVSKWERGLSLPDVELLTKCSTILDTPVSELIGIEEEPTKQKTTSHRKHVLVRVLIIIVSLFVVYIFVTLLLATTSLDSYKTHTSVELKEIQEP